MIKIVIHACYRRSKAFYSLCLMLYTVMPSLNKISYLILSYHISNLRRFQTLPVTTATCAVYLPLLIGALPLEAELHKRHLSLLYNILISKNKTVKELSNRQIAFNLDNSQSYFGRVQDILDIYNLPDLQCLRENLTSKENWKFQVKKALV